ncbi:MAG: superoxide dismutase family protein [Erythrobacter sp.]|nr:superoxide dismutase family protein [Erythrobacter sp.]
MIAKQTALACAAALLASPAATALAEHHKGQHDSQAAETARITNADGEDAGTIEFEQMRHGVLVRLRLQNLTPGGHAVHLHTTGQCSPDFKAAGGHYDPLSSSHGFDAAGGYHVGDLPNVYAGQDGTAKADMFIPQVSLKGPANDRYPFTLRDDDGTAIIVHAQEGNYVDMDSAGGREACGVIFAPM